MYNVFCCKKWNVPTEDIRKWKLDATQVGGMEIHHACSNSSCFRDVASALQIQSTPVLIKKHPNGQNYEVTMIATLLKSFLTLTNMPLPPVMTQYV
jgi:hypothetical protein